MSDTIQIVLSVDTNQMARIIKIANANGRTAPDQIRVMLDDASGPKSAGAPCMAPPRQTLDVEATMAIAIPAATALASGEEFMLRDTIPPEIWPLIENPRSCGHVFRARIERAGIATFIRRTRSRHAIYRRN